MNTIAVYCNGLHQSHEMIFEGCDIPTIELSSGSALDRIAAARRQDLSEYIVVSEGTQPLFQLAWMRKFGNCGPIVHLAADEGLMNVLDPLPHYNSLDRAAHWWAHRYVDGVIAVSPRLESCARVLGTEVTKTVHPAPTQEKWDEISEMGPTFGSRRVLVAGKNKPSNRLDALPDILEHLDDVRIDIVGPGTDKVDGKNITGHGFVSQTEYVNMFREAECLLHPGVSQPFPVVTLEALRAGLPPVVSEGVGTQYYIRKIDPELVQSPEPRHLAEGIEYVLELSKEEKEEMADRTQMMAKYFTPDSAIVSFTEKLEQIKEAIVQ